MAESALVPIDPIDDSPDDERSISFGEILAALRRRWWLVALLAGSILAVGYTRTAQEPRMYAATVTVRLQPPQTPVTGVVAGTPRLDYRIDPLLSEQALIKSEQVAERVVRNLGLRLAIAFPPNTTRNSVFGVFHPQISDSLRVGELTLRPGSTTYSLWSGSHPLGTARYGDTLRAPGVSLVLQHRPSIGGDHVTLAIVPLENAAMGLRGGITTRVVPSTDLIEITYSGTDPEEVQQIANAVATTYQSFSTEGSRDNAVQRAHFIDQSVHDQGRALATAQDALKHFKEQHQTGDVTDEAKALFKSIQEFEQQRRDVEAEQAVYQALVGKVTVADTVDTELRRLAGTGILAKNATIETKFTQWQDLYKKRQDLLLQGNLLPNNRDLRSYDAAISETKRGLLDATQVYQQGLTTRLQSVDQQIAQLKRQSEKYPPLEAEQLTLEANVQTQEKIYEDLQSQYQLARIAELADGGTVRIIDQAMVPNFAVSPNRKRAFFIYLLLGLLAGLGSAVALDRLDDSVRSPVELSERFRLPVLGMIPGIKAAELSELSNPAGLNRIVTHADPRSPVAESYRSLRTNLAFARSDGGTRTLVLTSPGPADGKSTTVANLAITFAQQGQRTLLIDADLRRAVLDKTFAVPRSPGLTDVLIGQKPLHDAVHTTQVANLSVLSSGQLPPNPSELLGSPAMRELIREASATFDVVLFDSPPLLAVTDAAVLSTIVDGTIIIARMGSTQRKALWRAVSQLRAVRANVLGGVLNDVSADVGAYYGGYGYYYYYSYHSDDTNRRGRIGVLGRLRRLATPH